MKYFNCQNPKNQVYLEHLGPCESWFSSTKYEECNKPCFGSNRPVCGSDLRTWLKFTFELPVSLPVAHKGGVLADLSRTALS